MSLIRTELSTTAHRPDTFKAYHVSVERAIQHMKENLAEPLDLGQFAEVAAVSKFHFVRVFDQVAGTTPHHFLACLRMQRAKELLLKSDETVTHICMEVGYASLGTFSKTFTTLVGLSPQEFRALPGKVNAVHFARAIWRYLAAQKKVSGPTVNGRVEGPGLLKGFTFVGTFDRGVPMGAPFSGTVLVKGGRFSIERPKKKEFYLLAALVPLSANFKEMIANIPIRLVASLRVDGETAATDTVLRLRPLRLTDPPIVMALPTLAPLGIRGEAPIPVQASTGL